MTMMSRYIISSWGEHLQEAEYGMGFYFLVGFLKQIAGFHFCHLQMYLAVNLPHDIATFGGVLLLTASHMIIQFLK